LFLSTSLPIPQAYHGFVEEENKEHGEERGRGRMVQRMKSLFIR
jgi:hypothetical protein